MAVYGLWLVVVFAHGRDPRDFTIIARDVVKRCHASSVIHLDRSYHYPPPHIGYDGQFYYLIALDPLHAACYLDKPAYRYTRILYPLTARVVALDRPAWIPVTMILVNLVAIAGGTFFLAAWLRRRGVSPWLALLYGLYPGLFVSLWRDLTEPLSYGLVALAVYLFDFGGRERAVWAGWCFALATLARETAVVFSVVYGLALVRRGERRNGALLLALALVPEAAYKVFLWLWLGTPGLPEGLAFPFTGLTHYWPLEGERIDLVLAVVIPALIATGVALWTLRRAASPEAVNLVLNVLIYVVMLPAATYAEYYAAGRATTGVVLATLLCIPLVDRLTARNRSWVWVTGTLWMLPWYALVPLAVTWANPGL